MSDPHHFGYERRDVNLRAVAKFTLSFFIFIGVALLAMGWLFEMFFAHQLSQESPPPPMLDASRQSPSPRLEPLSGQVVADTRAAEEPLLHGYAWVDREAGIARIPIARAMELIVAQHQARTASSHRGVSP